MRLRLRRQPYLGRTRAPARQVEAAVRAQGHPASGGRRARGVARRRRHLGVEPWRPPFRRRAGLDRRAAGHRFGGRVEALPVMIDCGIRGGLDVVRALALGAKFAFAGRRYRLWRSARSAPMARAHGRYVRRRDQDRIPACRRAHGGRGGQGDGAPQERLALRPQLTGGADDAVTNSAMIDIAGVTKWYRQTSRRQDSRRQELPRPERARPKSKRHGCVVCDPRHQPARAGRHVHRHRRRFRLRQDDAAQDRKSAYRRGRGSRVGRWRRGRAHRSGRFAPPHRLCLPGYRPVSAHDCCGEHRDHAAPAWLGEG